MLMLVLLLAGCDPATPQDGAPRVASSASPTVGVDPVGWRRESFRDVEVAVPSGWRQWVSDWPSCLRNPAKQGYVGRPGAVPAIGCLEAPDQDAATGGSFLWFEDDRPGRDDAPGGDRVTVRAGDVRLVVQAPAAVRERILASVRTGATDVNGCPVSHPISVDPSWRPAPAAATPASDLSVCRYELAPQDGHPRPAGAPSLIRSARITGPAAGQALARISGGEPGSGPNQRSFCQPKYLWGSEVIVLRAGRREVVMRYSGCDHHGFDDGTRVITLTKDAVAPLYIGSVNSGAVNNGRVADLLPPPH